MAENFELGFVINTEPLARTKKAADDAAVSLGKMGDAATQAGQKTNAGATQATTGITGLGTAAAGATPAVTGLGAALGGAAGAAGAGGAAGGGSGGGGLGGALGAAAGGAGRFVAAIGPIVTTVAGVGAGIAALATGYYQLNKTLAAAEDRLGLFNARMRNALGSQQAATETMRALYKATQETGLGFNEAADSFLRIARNADQLGASRQEIAQLSDTVAKLGAVSGASRGEIGSGMLQLSQALASGRLNGDELRSIMENMPALAKAIADGLGVSVGQLRAMGAAGELSSRNVFDAILRASSRANDEFARLPDTVERANQRAADSYDRLFATLGQRWNSSEFVRGVNNLFANVANRAAEIVAPPTLMEQIGSAEGRVSDLQARRDRFAALPGANRVDREGNPASDSARMVASLDAGLANARAELARLQSQNRREFEEARQAIAEEERKIARAFIDQGATVGANEFDSFNKRLLTTRQNLERVEQALFGVRARIAAGTAEDQDRNLLRSLERQAANGRIELEGLRNEIDKTREALERTERFSRQTGGSGYATGVLNRAQELMTTTRRQDPNTTFRDALGVVGGQEAQGLRDQTTELRRQTGQTNELAQAQSRGANAIRAVQLQQRLANEEFRFLGGPDSPLRTVPKLVAAWEAYKKAITDSTNAQNSLADAQAATGDASRIRVLTEQMTMLGRAYDQRRAQAEEDARRQTGGDRLRIFNLEEELRAREQILDIQQRTATVQAQSAPGMSERARQLVELEARIRQAQANVPAAQREALGTAMRGEDNANYGRAIQGQEDALNRQLALVQQRFQTLTLTTEEARVQNALMEKRNELEAAGVPQDRLERQLAITEQIQRQTIEYERQSRRVAGVMNTLESGIMALGNTFTSMFETVFRTGKLNGREFLGSLGQGVSRLAAQMTYEIGVKPFMEAAANMAKVFGTRLIGSLVGGGTTPTPAGGGGGGELMVGGIGNRQGNAFASGNVIPFYAGGIVNRPTTFPMSNGTGLMGEAGPEAILPLKRGSDGALGIRSGGGGGAVTVVINDMRSNRDSESASVQETTGPSGDRIISVLIRDEVRKGMANGDYDRTLSSSYNVSRSVQRR